MIDLATLETAAALLRCLWDGISPDYKAKYRRDIWQQVQDRVTTTARMTPDLGTWLSRLCLTFDNAPLAPYDPARRDWLAAQLRQPAAAQRAVLEALRHQAPVVVLLLRTLIQDEREVAANAPLRAPVDAAGGLFAADEGVEA